MPIIVSPSTTSTPSPGRTGAEYIHALAEESGEFGDGVTTSAGTTTTLVDTRFLNSALSSTELAAMYVLIETGACAGQVGTLRSLATGSGTHTVGDPFTTAIASGVAYTIYSLVPPIRKGVLPGHLQIVNQALRRLWVPDSISIAGVTNQVHYTIDVTAYPWFTDPRRIIEVQYPVTATDDAPRVLARQSWSWLSDGETRRLRFPSAPFATDETFVVRLYRPANSILVQNASLRAVLTATAVTSVVVDQGGYYTAVPTIAPASGVATFTAVMAVTPGPITSVTVGGGGAYTAGFPPALVVTRNASDTGWADQTSQTAGLATITDQALADVGDVVTMGKALLYETLSSLRQPGADVAEWLSKAAPNIRAARALQRSGLPVEAASGVIGGRYGAVRSGQRWGY